MNTNESIKAFEADRAGKVKDLTDIMENVGAEATLDAANQEKYDELAADIKQIDEHLTRLKHTQSLLATTATTVVAAADGKTAASVVQTGQRTNDGVIAVAKPLPKGVGFTRMALCMAMAKGDSGLALNIAKNRYPEEKPLHGILKAFNEGMSNEFIAKATIPGATTVSTDWAAPLVNYQILTDEFLEFLRPQTIVDRVSPLLTNVPFNVKIPRENLGGNGYWVGEGAPKPLTYGSLDSVTLGYFKIANIAVITDELARLSTPSAEAMVRNMLAKAIVQQLDADFVDPGNAGTANVKPASITNGVTAVTSSGATYDNIVTDVKAVTAPWLTANMGARGGFWIMPESTAFSLALKVNSLGQAIFPDLRSDGTGGTFFGLPVYTSESAGLHDSSSTERIVVLVKGSAILLADDGRVTVDASREASLQMLDNPTNNSATGTATTMVSMWQTNSLALRAERWIAWARARTNAVGVITNVQW